VAVRAKVVRIGNSRRIRLPKGLLEQVGLGEMVELDVQDGVLTVRPVKDPRAGWADAFREMAEHGDNELIDGEWPATDFDETEWEW
jgi:antitoxin MazE